MFLSKLFGHFYQTVVLCKRGGMGSANRMQQAAFQFRADDGVESLSALNGGASELGNINQDISVVSGTIVRHRALIVVTASSVNRSIGTFVRKNLGTYALVTSSTSDVKIFPSTFIVDRGDATDYVGRLGSGTWADLTNQHLRDISTSTLDCNYPSPPPTETEEECCFEITGNVGDFYDFRGRQQVTSTVYRVYSNGYLNTGRITIVAPVINAMSVDIKNASWDIKGGILDI